MPAQSAVDVGLVAAAALGASPEPCDDVRVETQRDLLLDRTVEDPAPGVRPVKQFGDVARVELIVGQFGKT